MNIIKLMAIALLFVTAVGPQRPAESGTKAELTAMLRQFLDDAGRGNRAGFETFFADDVVYTRSTGAVVNKGEILKNVESLKPTAESKSLYSADDITMHDYGDTAVVAFRLIARTEHKDGKIETAYFHNTGTFLRRGGRWQVVAWQATKISAEPNEPR
jgi:ketosteroid isomerase-like protein